MHTQSKMAGAQIFRLLGNFLTDILVASVSFESRCVNTGVLMADLLHRSERLVVTFESCIAELDLVNVRSSFLVAAPVFVDLCSRQFVGLVLAFVCLELISLLEAHLEIVLSVVSGLLDEALLAGSYVLCMLFQSSFVFRQIVKFVVAERKIGLNAANSRKHLFCIFLPLLDRFDFVLV